MKINGIKALDYQCQGDSLTLVLSETDFETVSGLNTALSLVGTLVGTLGGIALSSNLTNYRIEQLEKKVEKHNNLITRTYKLEQEFAVMDEKVKVANHRIDDLEDLEHES